MPPYHPSCFPGQVKPTSVVPGNIETQQRLSQSKRSEVRMMEVRCLDPLFLYATLFVQPNFKVMLPMVHGIQQNKIMETFFQPLGEKNDITDHTLIVHYLPHIFMLHFWCLLLFVF